MKRIFGGIILFLLAGTAWATFNSITDGDPGLAAPLMQNFRHVNFGSVLKPVDTNGVNSSATLDLGTNTVLWRDLYLSGTANVGATSVFGVNRVGIGTTTPATALNVLGDIQTQAGAFVGADIFTGLNATLNIKTAGASDAITFSQAGNTKMTIRSGFVGIGTTTPTTTLDVLGMGTFSGNLAVDTSTLYVDATNNRVGIGTTTPATALNVLGNIQTQAGASVGADIFTGLNATLNIKTAGASDAITFSQAGNTRMTISGGFLGVGTTTPTAALDVVGTVNISNITISSQPICSVYNSSANIIADATTTLITWNSEYGDVGSMHDTAVNNSRITIKKSGWYQVIAYAAWSYNATGYRRIILYKNGALWGGESLCLPVVTGQYTTQEINVIRYYSVNDYIELYAYQNRGGTLNFNGGSALVNESHLTVYLLPGPT